MATAPTPWHWRHLFLTPLPSVVCSDLDSRVLTMIFGKPTPEAASKLKSQRVKYILFAQETGALPVVPTKPANIFRYALWLPDHGIRSGWKGVMAYVTAICNWNKELGFPDPRDVVAFHWGVFRHNFQRLVTSHHPAMKLPIRPAMLEAMALDADLSNDTDLQDLTSYFLLFFAGFRIGTITASQHALKFEDVVFSPSFENCSVVLICVRSSKTRPRAANLPFWTAISRQPSLPFCPVELMQLHYLRAYRGSPQQNIFTTPAGTPLPRRTFNTRLRRRLELAQRRLRVPLDLSKFSAISFRKGCLSTLGALNVPAYRLADHADHSDVASSRIYTVDTVADRATNSNLIASSFLGGRTV